MAAKASPATAPGGLSALSSAAFHFCASLKLAVVLLSTVAGALAFATFYESAYGTKAVHWAIYKNVWFSLLLGCLGLNILCAALSRYPWKRHQTGFVITHAGLLTLLLGSVLSYQKGVDAQLLVNVKEKNSQAVLEEQKLVIESPGGLAEVVRFFPGPFNWDADWRAYHSWWFWTFGGLWMVTLVASLVTRHWRGRMAGVFAVANVAVVVILGVIWWTSASRQGPWCLFDKDRMRVDLLDYRSDTEVGYRPAGGSGPPHPAINVHLYSRDQALESANQVFWLHYRGGLAARERMGGGQFGLELMFWRADSPRQVEAFLKAVPMPKPGAAQDAAAGEPPPVDLGEKGQLVVLYDGKAYPVGLDDQVGKTVAIPGTPLSVEIVEYAADKEIHGLQMGPFVEVKVHGLEKPAGARLLAYHPDLASLTQTPDSPVQLAFFHPELPRQIQFLQGPDDRLYYRVLDRRGPEERGELSAGREATAWKIPMGTLSMQVVEHLPRAELEYRPLEFDRKKIEESMNTPAALFAVTSGAKREEFWLPLGGHPWLKLRRPGLVEDRANQRVLGAGSGRVALRYEVDTLPLSFAVNLREFELRLDPGTNEPANYTSWVTIEDPSRTDKEPADHVITMNEPMDYAASDRIGYRLFQASYRQPEASQPLWASIFAVHRDPGRPVKYMGSTMIVTGIACMFYMRAYFFKPAGRAVPAKRDARPKGSRKSEKDPVEATAT